MAAAQVLGIPELLEAILYELPMRDLLLVQRVNGRWRSTIQESKRLRRALFYEPVAGGSVKCEEHQPEYSYWGRDFIYYNEHGAIGNVYENELAGPFIDAMNLRSNQKSFTAALPASWHAPEAAWRNMLFTQPPFIGQVDVHQRGCPPGKKKYATAPIRTAENCRLGSIAAALEDRYMSFAGRGWLSCEVEGWLKWEHVDENRQLEDVVRAE